jgi:putative flippase GtrA
MEQTLQSLDQKVSKLLNDRPVILQLLKFAAIGSLNTALDFVILNFLIKQFGLTDIYILGALNILSFGAAIVQSYIWNRAWAFASNNVTPIQNLIRLILVGGLGFVSVLAVFYGATITALPIFYALILFGFLVTEFGFWVVFGLKFQSNIEASDSKKLFMHFLLISLIGLLINSLILTFASKAITPALQAYINPDLITNVAKVLATLVSLVWNFLGYKIFVFKK